MAKDSEAIQKANNNYDNLDRKYNGVKCLTVYGKKKPNSEEKSVMKFYRDLGDLGNRDTLLYFWEANDERIAYYERFEEAQRTGKKFSEQIPPRATKGFIRIDLEAKTFGFIIYQSKHGFEEYLYNHAQEILAGLGIEDANEYKIIPGLSKEKAKKFIKHQNLKRMVQKASAPYDIKTGIELMKWLGKCPDTLRFRDYNTLINYALHSGVSKDLIAQAINLNGLNIPNGEWYNSEFFSKEDLELFQSFNIPEIKPTCLHHHFITEESFRFMELVGITDAEDVYQELLRIVDYVQKGGSKRISCNSVSKDVLERFGGLAAVIVNWPHLALIVRRLPEKSQQIVKESAIKVFKKLDPTHTYPWNNLVDDETKNVLSLLKRADLMTEDTVERLYRGALSRNYDLPDFIDLMKRYTNFDVLEAAEKEIRENEDLYYPAPDGDGQVLLSDKPNYHTQSVKIPDSILARHKSKKIKTMIQAQIQGDNVAAVTYVRTSKKYRNLEEWMFGNDTINGYMRIDMNKGIVAFPPQTPHFALELVEGALKKIEDPNYGVRVEIE